MRYWDQPWGQHYMGYSGFWGSGIIGLIITVLFWGAIFFLIIALIKGFKKHSWEEDYEKKTEKSGKALDILKERYAKGEITKKVFEEMKKDIS